MVADHLDALRAALADRYDLERELGAGGMATVYLARDRKHRRAVAIKVLRPDVADAIGHERFLQEIETAAGLAHPHIVPVYDSGDAGGFLYYVMPYLAGETLGERLARVGQLPLEDALGVARDVAEALAYAHSHGVVHRDVKPANILLSGGHAVVADFGIAQAISAARAAEVEGRAAEPDEPDEAAPGEVPARRTPVVGTPAYMSPEQCLGSARLDGRSDIYSLGCVLYEMLAGHPPFRGETAAEIGAQHFADPPPPLAASGRAIPVEVEQAVLAALAKAPADRPQTALRFREALPAPSSLRVSGPTLTPRPPIARRRWSWPLVAAALAALLAAGAFALAGRYRAERGLDPSLYVLLPFGHREGAAPELLTGDRCESLLYEGISRWSDVRLVNLLRVHDAKARRGNAPVTFTTAMDIARELGAGRLIWGEVQEAGDSVQVHAAVYDVARRGLVVREHTLRLPRAGAQLGAAFNALADSLLLSPGRAPLAVSGAAGTDRLAAWREYQAGHEALARWQLAAAESAFAAAAALDPDYPHARLWLAQLLQWEERPASEWTPHAEAALRGPRRLAPHDAAVARGLAALGAGRYVEACGEYDALIAHDSADFQAWYGRGDCLLQDPIVRKDPRSPSGWRFRGGVESGIAAYLRALRLVPSAHVAFRGQAYARLRRRLFVEMNRFRHGYAAAAGDTTWFAAFPSLAHDTLAFVPYPMAALFSGAYPAATATTFDATARSRKLLAALSADWVQIFPRSPDALESQAMALELQGRLREPLAATPGALGVYRAARALAPDSSAQRLRLAAGEVRVLLKLEAFDSAAALADSLLAAARPGTPDEAAMLAGLAALTGRVQRTVELLRMTLPAFEEGFDETGGLVSVPPAIGEAALGLVGFGAFGQPEDSVRLGASRALRLVDQWAAPAARRTVTYAALNQGITFAFPVLGRTTLHRSDSPNFLLQLQTAAFRQDTALVRRRLAELDTLRASVRAGSLPAHGTHQEALLALQIGDTATAERRLDRLLGALSTLNEEILGAEAVASVPEAAGLVRCMALRARLATLRGDTPTARRWARAVVTLWRGADVGLQPIVGRMRLLAAAPGRS
ncbi:MAG TPA: serine/threonine-protein kinase [Gemmatimonadales bacterium]|nr:serine/threonine-protein kinase [Gemmatimonadales bacterium]